MGPSSSSASVGTGSAAKHESAAIPGLEGAEPAGDRSFAPAVKHGIQSLFSDVLHARVRPG